jgi:hypothetical protein
MLRYTVLVILFLVQQQAFADDFYLVATHKAYDGAWAVTHTNVCEYDASLLDGITSIDAGRFQYPVPPLITAGGVTAFTWAGFSTSSMEQQLYDRNVVDMYHIDGTFLVSANDWITNNGFVGSASTMLGLGFSTTWTGQTTPTTVSDNCNDWEINLGIGKRGVAPNLFSVFDDYDCANPVQVLCLIPMAQSSESPTPSPFNNPSPSRQVCSRL